MSFIQRFFGSRRHAHPSSPHSARKKVDTKTTPPRFTTQSPPESILHHLDGAEKPVKASTGSSQITFQRSDKLLENNTGLFQPISTLPHGEDIPIPVFFRDSSPSDLPIPFFDRDNPSSPPRVTRTNNTVHCLRSPVDVTTEREKCGFSFGEMPVLCYKSEDGLLSALKQWSQDITSDFGGFNISTYVGDLKTELKTRGPRRLLKCDRFGKTVSLDSKRIRQRTTKPCECEWAIWIEQSSEGWMVADPTSSSIKTLKSQNTPMTASHHSIHNHRLYTSIEQKITNPAMRHFTDEQHDKAKMLAEANCPSTCIYTYLYDKCKEKNEPIFCKRNWFIFLFTLII